MPVFGWTLRCGVFLSIALAAGCTAGPATNLKIGQIVTPGNTQIPLPPGEWTLLASDSTASGRYFGGGINNQHSSRVYYAKIENGHIAQLVFASTSAGAPSEGGYGTGANCLQARPSDFVYFADPSSGSINAIDCVKVTGNRVFNQPSQSSSAIYRAAYDTAKTYGGFPRYAVQVEIAEAHNLRYQDYFMYFFPDQAVAATRAARWRVDDMAPENRSFVDGVIGWAKDFRHAVRLGTDYRL